MLLVPMLAFDARGHRLGYGGGFYDRTIAGCARGGRCTALGLRLRRAGDAARCPTASTDMRLDAIVTEAGSVAGVRRRSLARGSRIRD